MFMKTKDDDKTSDLRRKLETASKVKVDPGISMKTIGNAKLSVGPCPTRQPTLPPIGIGRMEMLEESTRQSERGPVQLARRPNPRVTDFPVSVLGRTSMQEGDSRQTERGRYIMDPAAHTPPLRLSGVSGERMKQFADSGNRKSSIANYQEPDHGVANGLAFCVNLPSSILTEPPSSYYCGSHGDLACLITVIFFPNEIFPRFGTT
jgi:hypothetical protein